MKSDGHFPTRQLFRFSTSRIRHWLKLLHVTVKKACTIRLLHVQTVKKKTGWYDLPRPDSEEEDEENLTTTSPQRWRRRRTSNLIVAAPPNQCCSKALYPPPKVDKKHASPDEETETAAVYVDVVYLSVETRWVMAGSNYLHTRQCKFDKTKKTKKETIKQRNNESPN